MVNLDVFGCRYDTSEPSFMEAGPNFYWHRPDGRLIGRKSLEDWVAAEGKTFGPNERGPASAAFDALDQNAPLAPAGTVAPPVQAAVTATADLSAKTVTVAGGPADQAYTVTVTYQIDGSASDVTVDQVVAQADTADAVATALAAKFTGDLTATAAGGVVTIALGTATALDVLSVAVT